tara:strand:- start:143 stop:361 length:219 start_codon:yes stop_codon:yes gene_type:complete
MLIVSMLLLCAENNLGNPQCKTIINTGFVTTVEDCMKSLEIGIRVAENNGWTVARYECYDWLKGGDLSTIIK